MGGEASLRSARPFCGIKPGTLSGDLGLHFARPARAGRFLVPVGSVAPVNSEASVGSSPIGACLWRDCGQKGSNGPMERRALSAESEWGGSRHTTVVASDCGVHRTSWTRQTPTTVAPGGGVRSTAGDERRDPVLGCDEREPRHHVGGGRRVRSGHEESHGMVGWELLPGGASNSSGDVPFCVAPSPVRTVT
jgi:hypothetical protein